MSRQATVSHPLCARLYVKQAEAAESRGLTDQRRRMLAGLAGEVVDIGAGNGLNFPHYPDSVTMLHAFEPEPYLRALAMQAAESAAVRVSVGAAIAEDLPLEDASVDAAVASLVLCSVKDVAGAPSCAGLCDPAANFASMSTLPPSIGFEEPCNGRPTRPCGRRSPAAAIWGETPGKRSRTAAFALNESSGSCSTCQRSIRQKLTFSEPPAASELVATLFGCGLDSVQRFSDAAAQLLVARDG